MGSEVTKFSSNATFTLTQDLSVLKDDSWGPFNRFPGFTFSAMTMSRDELHDGEGRRRRREQRREADRRGDDVHEPARGDPERGHEPGAPALVDALGDDVGDRRAGHDDERERGGVGAR